MEYLSRAMKQMQHFLGLCKKTDERIEQSGVTENAMRYANLVYSAPSVYAQHHRAR